MHNLNKDLILDEFNPEILFQNYGFDNFIYKKNMKVSDLLFEIHGIESKLKN